MRKYIYFILAIFTIIFSYLIYDAFFIKKESDKTCIRNIYEKKASLRYPTIKTLKEGDLIFRRMYDVDSTMARKFSEGEKRYSHAGMVVESNHKKWVLHILTNKGVFLEPIKSFLAETKVWAIYRLKNSKHKELNHQALSYLDKNVTFDNHYNLETKNALYCTELMRDIINSVYNKEYIVAKKQFAGRKFVTISDMYENNHTLLVQSSHKLIQRRE